MGNDLQKGTTYATGGVGGQGSITSANLNAHVDDATIKPTFISAKAARAPGVLTDNLLLESGGALYRILLSTLKDLFVQSGSVIQTVVATPYTANADLGIIPFDDTIPQDTEGTQILTLSITPRSSTNQIRLTFNGWGGTNLDGGNLIVALFRAGTANALKTTTSPTAGVGYRIELNIDWVDSPGTTTSQTYNIRAGVNPSTTGRMNGNHTSRSFGGSAACTLIAQEIKV